MGKEDLIVDNPLLLTSLFAKGIFAIPPDAKSLETNAPKSSKIATTTESPSNENIATKDGNAAPNKEVTENAAVHNTELNSEINHIQNSDIIAPTKQVESTSEPREILKPTVMIPKVSVLHLVVETGKSPYREETIPNAMNALGKLLSNKQTPSFDIVDVTALNIPLKDYFSAIPPNVKVVFWGKDSHLLQGVDLSNKQCLLLNMPSVMLASQENKLSHWNQIKAFFQVN